MSKLSASLPPPGGGRSDGAAVRVGVMVLTPPRLMPSAFADPPPPGEGEALCVSPAALRNVSRFIEARLHAVSSRNMYSEHGLLARIAPEAGQVCQSLMDVWNCRPGSAQAQAA